VAALVLFVALVGSVPPRVDKLVVLVAGLGVVAVLALLLALLAGWPGLVAWALAFCGAEYAVFLVVRGGSIDAYAPLYGAGLLLVGELAHWALEPKVSGGEQGLLARRVSLIAATCLAAAGIGGLVLSVSELVVHGGLLLEAFGVAAAVAALFLLARMARPEQ
jgi:hypothetical protein